MDKMIALCYTVAMKNERYGFLGKDAPPNPFMQTAVKIEEADVSKVDRSWNQFVAFFPYYRLYYILSGHARMFLQNGEIDLHPGNIYFIPAFSVVDAKCEASLEHIWFHFRLDLTTANYLTVLKPRYAAPEQKGDEEIFRTIVSTFNSPAHDSPAATLKTDGLCRYLMSRFLDSSEHAENLSEAARFIPVLQYIDEHIARPISNAELAGLLYLSTTYFANLFTKQFGMPPRQYVLNKRMSAAAAMLLERDMTVKEIAFALGFENESYFNRLFRKFTGMPPNAYRKLNVPPAKRHAQKTHFFINKPRPEHTKKRDRKCRVFLMHFGAVFVFQPHQIIGSHFEIDGYFFEHLQRRLVSPRFPKADHAFTDAQRFRQSNLPDAPIFSQLLKYILKLHVLIIYKCKNFC